MLRDGLQWDSNLESFSLIPAPEISDRNMGVVEYLCMHVILSVAA